MKKRLVIFLICAFALAGVGCAGKSENASTGDSVNGQVAETTSGSEATEATTVEAEPVHEHTYVYTSQGDGTHKISCSECGETEKTEPCSFDENYVCTACGFKHEHEFVDFVYDEETPDGHVAKCTAEFCEESLSEPCTLGEDGICAVCGHQHEHTYDYYEKSKNQYYKKCKFEGCAYEEEAWKCWKLEWRGGGDVSYHHTFDSYDYYVVRDVDVYDIPDLENGTVVGQLNKNDKVTITGATYYNDTHFDRTGDGYYIPNLGYYSTIALCRTNQVVVLKSIVGSGIYYDDPANIVAVYASKDEAFIAMTGHDRAYIKANGTYRAPMFPGDDSAYILYDGDTKIQMGEFNNNEGLWINDQPYTVYQPSSK